MKILISLVLIYNLFSISIFAEELDPELSKIIQLANQKTPDLKLLSALIDRQEGQRISARSNYLPNLNLSVGAYNGRVDELNRVADVAAEDKNWRARLEFVQFLYKGNKIESTYQKSKFLKNAAEYRLSYFKQNMKLKLTEIFYTYLYLKEYLKIKNSFLRELKSYTSKIKIGKKLGDNSDFDLTRAELIQNNLETKIPSIETNLELTFNQFLEFLEIDDVKFIESSNLRSILDRPIKRNVLESKELLFKKAQENSLEIQRFKELIAAAKEEVDAQKSGNLPEVSLFANYSFESDDQDFRDSVDDWRVGLRASWNLFDGYETRGYVKSAKAELKERELQLDRFKLNLQKELLDNYTRFTRSLSIIPMQKKIISKSKKATSQVKLLLESGETKHIDFIDVLETEHMADIAYLNAVRDNHIYIARIDRYIKQY